MKKKSFLLAIILSSCIFVFGQNELMVNNSSKGLYVNHTVGAKENFYSIGRLYNISPKDIGTYNALDMAKGLSIGQIVKIPLTQTNFSQTTDKGRPVYYTVGEKEGLYRVSVKNNNVLMANLRKWNHLANDNMTAGKKLVVGYLISTEANTSVPPAAEQAVSAKKEATETVKEKKQEVTETKTKEKKPATIEVKEPEKKSDISVTKQVPPTPIDNSNGGYFKNLFDKQIKAQPLKVDETLTAGIFKTTSGWQDSKYYALVDNVEPGTIIRIVNPTNNKAVYAKVLGEMSSIRQNQGYNMRMSNAAAAALEINDDDKFAVRINY